MEQAEAVERLSKIMVCLDEVLEHLRGGGSTEVVQSEFPEATEIAYEVCSKCGGPKDRHVPAGVSKRTGKAYSAFWACGRC